jgi:pimeloyl-ACP methyl ester carboxylesterase
VQKKIKIIGKIFGILLLAYGIVATGFYFFQDSFIFQSKSLPKDYVFTFDQKFEEHFIPTEDGEKLNALLFRSQQPAKGLILYFHGNADNLQRWGQYAVDFTNLGYDILMIDYRGYGKSTGTPTEENLYKDAQTILNWSHTNIKYERLIIYGRSLGSAVASSLASTATPDILILETPFDELSGALYLFPARYNFSNKEFLPLIKCKKVVFHGTDDWVVPLSSALKLKPLLNENDRFVIIEGASHNNLRAFEKYHKTLNEVLE